MSAQDDLDIVNAPAWGARLRSACHALAATAASEAVDPAAAPLLLVDLRPVRLLSAAAMSEMATTRELSVTCGVEMAVLLEAGGWAQRMLRASGLARCFAVVHDARVGTAGR